MIKYYNKGEDFLIENKELISSNPSKYQLLVGSVKKIGPISATDFCGILKTQRDTALFASEAGKFLRVFGDDSDSLMKELADSIKFFNKQLIGFMGSEINATSFIRYFGGEFKQIMTTNIREYNGIGAKESKYVKEISINDLSDYTVLLSEYYTKALKRSSIDYEKVKQVALDLIEKHYAFGIYKDGMLVSSAAIKRIDDGFACISYVVTKENYNGLGFCQQIIKHITALLTKDGKICSIFADKCNPISNHVYEKCGYLFLGDCDEYSYLG